MLWDENTFCDHDMWCICHDLTLNILLNHTMYTLLGFIWNALFCWYIHIFWGKSHFLAVFVLTFLNDTKIQTGIHFFVCTKLQWYLSVCVKYLVWNSCSYITVKWGYQKSYCYQLWSTNFVYLVFLSHLLFSCLCHVQVLSVLGGWF